MCRCSPVVSSSSSTLTPLRLSHCIINLTLNFTIFSCLLLSVYYYYVRNISIAHSAISTNFLCRSRPSSLSRTPGVFQLISNSLPPGLDSSLFPIIIFALFCTQRLENQSSLSSNSSGTTLILPTASDSSFSVI